MNNWLDLENKVIIVTGGMTGIGQAIVNCLKAQQAKTAVLDLKAENKRNDDVYTIPCDISNKKQVENAIDKIVDAYGHIDGLINNAGVAKPELLVDENGKYEISEASFDFLFNINVKGTIICAQAATRQFLKQGYGVVVNMSSECGMEGSSGQSLYAATKGAINALTRSWAKEYGSKHIRFVAIAPGVIEQTAIRSQAFNEALAYTRHTTVDNLTPNYQQSIPLGYPGKLTEIADLVAYLVSPRSSYITGTVINISGGKSRG